MAHERARLDPELFFETTAQLELVPKAHTLVFDVGPERGSEEWGRLSHHSRDACHWFRAPYLRVASSRVSGPPPPAPEVPACTTTGLALAGEYEQSADVSADDQGEDVVHFDAFRGDTPEEFERRRVEMREGLLQAELVPKYAPTSSMLALLSGRLKTRRDPHTLKPLHADDYTTRFLIKPKSFELGGSALWEPFFVRFAVYDVHAMAKLTEDVCVDLNPPTLTAALPAGPAPHPAVAGRQFVLSVAPGATLYLVALLYKVPNLAAPDTAAAYAHPTDKLRASAGDAMRLLGSHRQLCAWSARRLFDSSGQFLLEGHVTEMAPFFPITPKTILLEELAALHASSEDGAARGPGRKKANAGLPGAKLSLVAMRFQTKQCVSPNIYDACMRPCVSARDPNMQETGPVYLAAEVFWCWPSPL